MIAVAAPPIVQARHDRNQRDGRAHGLQTRQEPCAFAPGIHLQLWQVYSAIADYEHAD